MTAQGFLMQKLGVEEVWYFAVKRNNFEREINGIGCTEGEIRLVNEYTEDDNDGRVKVCINGRWGTVQTSQPRELAEAVCRNHSRQLESFGTNIGENNSSALYSITELLLQCAGTQFGYRQSKPVYYCDVNCNGRLTCSEGYKDHSSDLGVVCGPPLEDDCMSHDSLNTV